MTKSPDVVVVGMGYIGLPTATLIAKRGLYVHGVDIDQNTVNVINSGSCHIIEPELESEIKEVVRKGNLQASTSVIPSDVYMIVVPTPFKANNQPDTSIVEAATQTIIPLLKAQDLFIIESTSPVKTTERIAKAIFKKRPELKGQIHIAYCPERVLPGNIMYELVNNDRVIGGINEISTKKAVAFYQKFVNGELYETSSSTAEMCKLVENASRDVQIAFANELSLICEKANIDVWELINLANKHPRVNILRPSVGVGGHCLAVDPYFLVSDYPDQTKLITKARQVNSYKPMWCAEKIQNAKLNFELKEGRKPKIALMGLAYKPNIDDLRESPAKSIVQMVLKNSNNEEHFIVEPNITSHKIFKLTDYTEAVSQADIIAVLVGHEEFQALGVVKDKQILDFCGILS
jgi:UDP-N-acetyl-D-mannosaminuronic acid dehydrogenase